MLMFSFIVPENVHTILGKVTILNLNCTTELLDKSSPERQNLALQLNEQVRSWIFYRTWMKWRTINVVLWNHKPMKVDIYCEQVTFSSASLDEKIFFCRWMHYDAVFYWNCWLKMGAPWQRFFDPFEFPAKLPAKRFYYFQIGTIFTMKYSSFLTLTNFSFS